MLGVNKPPNASMERKHLHTQDDVLPTAQVKPRDNSAAAYGAGRSGPA